MASYSDYGLTLPAILFNNTAILFFIMERCLGMYKVVAMLLTVLLVVMGSGCALVSRHTAPVDDGTKTTVGLFGFGVIDNGYPMIPFYSGFDQGK